ncbi:pyridoxamine 5'-phosphate oxidase family protein [Pararhizobium sp. DWP1-1-3]|uniref:pyridoxamine 5'-phosphate oxidase family protein n=1 Tax=Pararhizobium sp. DWP1-1-3 TaxID=2804652 RepID=UPI003CECDB92
MATFVSEGHDIFAAIHGNLGIDNDRALIDRLWNNYVAAWYEGGKDDPKLVLLRLDAEHAEKWKGGSSLWAEVKTLFGGAGPSRLFSVIAACVTRWSLSNTV